jgi:hypothetical protein
MRDNWGDGANELIVERFLSVPTADVMIRIDSFGLCKAVSKDRGRGAKDLEAQTEWSFNNNERVDESWGSTQ